MPIRLSVAPAAALLPRFDFHWDAETEILAGRQTVAPGDGFTGSWELESPAGAVVIMESEGGVLSGVEVVVWPDVERAPKLVAPHVPSASRVELLPPPDGGPGLVAVETPMSAEASVSETLIRLRFAHPAARTVRVAENLLVGVTEAGELADLWFEDLPLFPSGG